MNANPPKINRRRFLKIAGLSVAATAACGSLAWAGAQSPEPVLTEKTFGGSQAMNSKILVTYATRAGSTAEVATRIAETLSAQGAAVDLVPVKKVTSLSGYRAVVLGSAVKFSAWLPEAVQFVQRNQAALSQMPCAFFSVHLMNLGSDEASREKRQAYLDPVRKLVVPRQEAFFAGVGDLNKVSVLERLIGKMVKSPEGDLRDWPAIQTWAYGLPATF